MQSMKDNDVWDLIKFPEGEKWIGCKWIFKIKRDSKRNIEKYKTCLIAKGFSQREDIDYKEILSIIIKRFF